MGFIGVIVRLFIFAVVIMWWLGYIPELNTSGHSNDDGTYASSSSSSSSPSYSFSGVRRGGLSFSVLLDLGMLLVGLLWLFVITKYPWDLYFKARRAHDEMQEALQNRTTQNVTAADLSDLKNLKQRFLTSAFTAHFVSALAVYLIDRFTNDMINPHFVWLFGVSCLLRPTVEWLLYMQDSINTIHRRIDDLNRDSASKNELKYENVQSHVSNLKQNMSNKLDGLERSRDDMKERIDKLQKDITRFSSSKEQRFGQAGARVTELAHRLQTTAERLVVDKESMDDVKGFVKSVGMLFSNRIV